MSTTSPRRDARPHTVARPDPAWSVLDTPIGPLTLVAGDAGLRAVWFADEARPPLDPAGRVDAHETAPPLDTAGRVGEVAVGAAGHLCQAAATQLTEYFAGTRTVFDLPLDLPGTPFQREVWAALLTIPHGRTRAYGAIAAEISARRLEQPPSVGADGTWSQPGCLAGAPAGTLQPTSARAVAAAVGRTPVPIIVPCHRVVGAAGSLTGYRGGLPRKRALLQLEGAAIVAPGGTPAGAASRTSITAAAAVRPGQSPLL